MKSRCFSGKQGAWLPRGSSSLVGVNDSRGRDAGGVAGHLERYSTGWTILLRFRPWRIGLSCIRLWTGLIGGGVLSRRQCRLKNEIGLCRGGFFVRPQP